MTGRLPEHELIELSGFDLMYLGHEMLVAVERRLDRRVAQMVKADRPHARASQCRWKLAVEVVRVEGCSTVGAEHKL